jgi:hypothetical protein
MQIANGSREHWDSQEIDFLRQAMDRTMLTAAEMQELHFPWKSYETVSDQMEVSWR